MINEMICETIYTMIRTYESAKDINFDMLLANGVYTISQQRPKPYSDTNYLFSMVYILRQ